MNLSYIPSPARGVIHLGPIPLRGYAFCIIIGVFLAIWLGSRRWIARGGHKGTVADIAMWAVPFGLIGGRLYHVITTYEPYFGEHGRPLDALKIWEGGLGIWGAIALGALGAWIGCRVRGVPLPAFADAVAPGIAFAQAIGRWGNWFNQELFGKPSDLPWAVKIDEGKRVPGGGLRDVATYHPTFLYEFLWCIVLGLLVLFVDRKFRLGHGRAFAVYVAGYTVGRFWIEYLRIDDAHHIWGLRLNDWTSIGVFVAAVIYFVVSAKLRPGRETAVEPVLASAAPAANSGGSATPGGSGTPSGSGDPAAPDGAAKPAEGSPDLVKRTQDSDVTTASGSSTAGTSAQPDDAPADQDTPDSATVKVGTGDAAQPAPTSGADSGAAADTADQPDTPADAGKTADGPAEPPADRASEADEVQASAPSGASAPGSS